MLANLGFPGCYKWEEIYLVAFSNISCFQMDDLKKILNTKQSKNFSQIVRQVKHEIARTSLRSKRKILK